MLVINPDECIDCGVCEPECPIEAIIPDIDPRAEQFLELNREYSAKWPVITKIKPALPNADALKDKKGKLEELFDPAPGDGD